METQQLWFVIEAILALKSLEQSDREEVLGDPYLTKDLLWSLPIGSGFLARNMLLHLLHPEVFEDVASRRHKAAIVAHYKELTTEIDEDRALTQIRAHLQEGLDSQFSFYAPEIRAEWDPTERS